MDRLKQMNEAMRYIEEHLEGSIDLERVAKKAYSSEYEFTRIFSFLSGMTLSEYIRKRRLTLAAMELQKLDAKVIDVALKYGYSSPDAFTRAFQKFHGVLPSEAKTSQRTLKACPMMTFRLTIEGGNEMDYRIVEKEAFRIVGVKTAMEMMNEELSPSYDVVFDKLTDSLAERLEDMSSVEPRGVIHVTADYTEKPDGTGQFDQYTGAAVKPDEKVEDLDVLDVPALTWVVFSIEGEWNTVEKEWARIYSEWLPSSSYELVNRPEMVASKHEQSEIWIPVKVR